MISEISMETFNSSGLKEILVVDDEESILEVVRYYLVKHGYSVRCAAGGSAALREIRLRIPDLLVLDLMLPEMSGIELCKLLKADVRTKNIPIIMLTARSEDRDILRGFEIGADDYVTKPFNPQILLARINSVLRKITHAMPVIPKVISIHDLTIDTARRVASIGATELDLTATEYELLSFMARNPGAVFTRAQLVEAVHGTDYPVTDRSVDVQVVGLRKKMGDYSDYLETVWGVGYRFRE